MNALSATRADPFESLNEAQRRAVDHGRAPLLVIAGAGTGKTQTLSCRVARLVRDGADPARILLLTFSRRAAGEMTKRVGAVLARATGIETEIGFPWAGTFHAIGAKILREFATNIGLNVDFTIHDRSDSADLMGLARDRLDVSITQRRFPTKGTCLAIYSRAVNTDDPLDEVLRSQFPRSAPWEAELKQLFALYVEMKQAQNVLDYDDLLLYWADLMEVDALAQEIGRRFDHVLVDEYQDTNKLQSRILMRMKPDGAGVTVVGDDAQSIYSFRAATVRNILDFPKAYAPEAEIVTLEQNYRSTKSILSASNAVIARASERYTKTLYSERRDGEKPRIVELRDEAEQARYVSEQILDAREHGTELKAQAVLFRAADASAQLELELQRRDIPFKKFGGLKFLEAAHVKDMVAILRWAQNASDRLAGFRALQLVPGVGPGKAGKVLDAPRAEQFDTIAAPADREIWDGFVALMRDIRALRNWPAPLDLVRAWYEPVLETRYDDAQVRARDIAQLARIGAAYPNCEAFLTDLTLDPPSATSDEAGPPSKDDDYLILSTIHSAKGQEWRNVFVLNAVDGCIPADLSTGSSAEIEEERRLLYVAMTRAKEALHIITPQRFYVQQQSKYGDKAVFASRTRFIPTNMLDHFEIVTYASPEALEAHAAPAASVNLAARALNRWR
ncbi:MAG: ATP-dependent helicase [Pseudomonadota bacterium]